RLDADSRHAAAEARGAERRRERRRPAAAATSPRVARAQMGSVDGDSVTDRRALAALTALWLAAILIVNPSGDFPILDDWAYGHVVRTLVTEHRFALTDWTSVPLVTQALWGALFCLPAGFSFTTLR